jgi:hypothetical protein
MSRGPDVATLLERALVASAAAAGCPVTIRAADWTRWSSATFTGARHELTLEAPASLALNAWTAALPEAEFRLRGHIVADLCVARRQRRGDQVTLSLEVLTVESR